MNSQNIHTNYFLKKAHSKVNIKSNKKKIPINKTNNINNGSKKNELIDEDKNNNRKSIKSKEFQIINNSISTNSQDSILTTNRPLDSDNNNLNKKNINKDIYIKKLEKKIQNQAHQLSQLLEYKDLCEKKIKELSPKEVLPLTIDTLNANFYTNRDSKTNKSIKKSSKYLNSSYSNKIIKSDLNDYNNYEKTLELNINPSDYKEKYDNLFSKYLKLLNDIKKTNNNNNNDNIQIIKLKNNLYKLQTEYDNMKEKLNNIKEINKELNIKIKKLENINNKNDNSENSRNLKGEVDMLRKDLVLSQALINSLKSEIIMINKNNKKSKSVNNKPIKKIKRYNLFPYNINDDEKNNYENLNHFMDMENNKTNNDINSLINENNILNKSLYNKNVLISNMLEENNKLNNLLKTKGINTPENMNLNTEKNINNDFNKEISTNNNIEQIKNNLLQYENKLFYFNDYISNIKKQIYKLHQDIIQKINSIKSEEIDNNEKDNFCSKEFNEEMKNVKDNINNLNIDFYSLDYSHDIKCLEINMIFTKNLIDRLNQLINNFKNYNIVNTKEINSIIDLFEFSKAVIKDEPLKKTLTDIFNITQSINRLYKQKYLNNKDNDNIEDLDKVLITQEKELELIKKSLFDISNFRKTYYMTSYQTENNINYKSNFRDNGNKYFNEKYNNRNNTNIKKYSYSREKIINRPFI